MTVGSRTASACTETNSIAPAAWARRMRSRKEMNWSRSRVRNARMPGSRSMRAASVLAMSSTTSFSRVPPGPIAPGSCPPCPGSMATTTVRPLAAGACAALTGFSATGAATSGTPTSGADDADGGGSGAAAGVAGAASAADADATALVPPVTSNTNRCAPAPRIKGVPIEARAPSRSSTTTRNTPPGCAPIRSPATSPAGAGKALPKPSRAPSMSITARRGASSMKKR